MRWVADAQEMAQAFSIRHEVFVLGQGVPEELELDGLDAQCNHALATLNGAVVGTARLRTYHRGTAKVERVAVVEWARGHGLGAAIMTFLEAGAGKEHDTIVLNAQKAVVEFYLKLGYTCEGPEFDEAGIVHQRMFKRL